MRRTPLAGQKRMSGARGSFENDGPSTKSSFTVAPCSEGTLLRWQTKCSDLPQ